MPIAVVTPVDVRAITVTETDLKRFEKFNKRGSRSLTDAAKTAVKDMKETSGRRTDTPVRKHFLRSWDGSKPPMARLYTSGGRGREVALKLYLALIWRCSGRPFSTQKPARFWAALLDLDDPEVEGARRIQRALKALAEVGLIELTPDPGAPTVVTLLDEHADGTQYTLPSSSYSYAANHKAKVSVRERHTYFKVPTKLWTKGVIHQLAGPGLVMLLILLAEKAGEGDEVWFGTTIFKERYAISHKTRADGTAELLHHGLVSIRRQRLPDRPNSRSYETEKWRSVYSLTKRARLAVTPPPPTVVRPLVRTTSPPPSPPPPPPPRAPAVGAL